uniref:Uncharacterized protein n=1 Tax=Vespula pensylvanica TaxID=30213 RepID=A0A834P8H5_VESPE|nr:hypothetical protein H0235_005010 [Vespula pensylvanica]
MWQDLDGLAGAGVHSGTHQVDQFGTAVADLTPEQQKILIDIRRKKSELLLEIQVLDPPTQHNNAYFACSLHLLRNEPLENGGGVSYTIAKKSPVEMKVLRHENSFLA